MATRLVITNKKMRPNKAQQEIKTTSHSQCPPLPSGKENKTFKELDKMSSE